jgi:hypothetical protein
MIKVFYHIACMGPESNWRPIVEEQVRVINSSGLYKDCGQIYVCVGTDGKPLKESKILKRILPEKYKIVYYSKLNQWELPSLHMIKEYTKPEDQIFYLHTKAASKSGDARISGNKWRQYMMYWCIERYHDVLKALKTNDTAGAQLTNLDNKFANLCGAKKVYAGNFWAANGDYISKLKAPEIGNNRWLAEGWLFQANPKAFDLHNLTGGGLITAKNTFHLKSFSRKVYDPTFVEKVIPEMMCSRIEVIQTLINKFNYKSYLEIGIWNSACFNAIKCPLKHSVDPFIDKATFKVTSDDFFKQNTRKYSCFFVDGLHTAEQVERDILNALDCLEDGGSIVVHDTLANSEWETRYNTEYDGKGIWLGDVYKTIAKLRMTRKDLSIHCLDLDFGVCIIRKGSQELYPECEVDYPYYHQHRDKLMNVITPENALEFLEGLK